MHLGRSGFTFFLPRFYSAAFWSLAASASLALAPFLAAQPAYLTDVKAWRGRFTARTHVTQADLPPEVAAKFKSELSINVSISAEVVLDQYDSNPSEWTGRVVSSSITNTYHCHLDAGDTVIDCDYSTAGPFEPESTDAPPRLTFHAGAGWELNLYGVRRANNITTVTKFIKSGKQFTENQQSIAFGASGSDGDFPYPSKGFVLQGRGKYTKNLSTSGSVTLTPPMTYDVEVYLEPTDKAELKLEIEKPDDYDTWRPTTKGLLSPGEPLKVSARVVTEDGSELKARVESFTWKLIDTSREPGVVLNYPAGADDTDYDLKLDSEGGYFARTEDGQQIERAVEKGHSDFVVVNPQDWGAWSTLEVTAKLADGRELKGKLKGENDFGLRLPKRSATSKIADSWKKTSGASGEDASDEDNSPEGDKNKGDGFSLYEEYRGFYVDGKHVSGNPKQKELFVRIDPGASDALAGVLQFKRISRLNVLHKLTENEFPASRVMNANRKEGPHAVDQHGILVRKEKGQFGYAYANGPAGRPSTPKGIEAVQLPERWGITDAHFIASTVAHELGHAVNLWHHGETDTEVVWRVQNGKLLENGQEITVINENLEDITDGMIAFVELSVEPSKPYLILPMGEQRGQHSGFENCVMRYDNAQVYKHPTQPGVRISEFVEITGSRLCTSPAGSGVNDPGRMPFPRYDAAAASRGDCVHQILVNDAVPPPAR